jgi:lipopolysaccharide transport system permease protein
MWRDLLASRELAWRLLTRNISAQYRQTVLGYVWAFLPPLAMTFVWVLLHSQRVVQIQETDLPYAAYVMIGTLLWQVFVDSLNSPLKLVTSSREMLVKINFPREALILAGLGEVVFNLLVRLVLLVGVFVWFQLAVPWTVVLAPLGFLSLIGLGLVVGLVLTPVGVLFQDVQYGITTLTYLWFFVTPVVYPPPTDGLAARVVSWNPVTPILLTTRDWCATGESSHLGSFLIVTTVTVVLIMAGWLLFRLAMPHLIARISA